MHHVRAAALTFALLLSACSTATSTPVTADAGDGDVAQGTQNDWSCLGKVTFPAVEGTTSDVTFNASDTRGKPIANVDVRACPDREDATCANATSAKKTDANGNALFTVPIGANGFTGYFEATEPGDAPNLHFVPNRIWKTSASEQRVEWRAAELKILTDTVGLSLDATKGNVLFQTQDCRSKSLPNTGLAPSAIAGGVTVSIEPMPAGVSTAYVVPTQTFQLTLQWRISQRSAGRLHDHRKARADGRTHRRPAHARTRGRAEPHRPRTDAVIRS
jgi:hypothetical protein